MYKQKCFDLILNVRKLKKVLEKLGHIFQVNLLPQPISTTLQKEISILSHIAKKIQALQYLQNCLWQPGMFKKILNLGDKIGLFCP